MRLSFCCILFSVLSCSVDVRAQVLLQVTDGDDSHIGTGTLRDAINTINQDPSGAEYTIQIESSPNTLLSPLPPINIAKPAMGIGGSVLSHNVTVHGNGSTIDGQNLGSIFFFVAPSTATTLTLNDLILTQGKSKGGNGGFTTGTNLVGGCGGGALGAGGALFVYQGSAIVQNCNITGCSAEGGAGGSSSFTGIGDLSGGGGGGGMLAGNGFNPSGDGLVAGGGGGVGSAASSGSGGSQYGNGGAPGDNMANPVGYPGQFGGGGGGGYKGNTDGGRGGDGGTFSGAGGGGANGSSPGYFPGAGALGGYGSGGGGCGGRNGGDIFLQTHGGDGGAGGGGGGGGGVFNGPSGGTSIGGSGGTLSNTAYKGGNGGHSDVGTSVAEGGGGGGGGVGVGGGIFVANNGSVTILTDSASTTFSGNTVAGGAGGTASNPAFNGAAGNSGGTDIFCDTGGTLNFQIASGLTQSFTSAGQALVAGTLTVTGPGTLAFGSGTTPTYSGLSITGGGTVSLYATNQLPAGSATVTFSGDGAIQTLAALGAIANPFSLSKGNTGTFATDFPVTISGNITEAGMGMVGGNFTKTGTGTLTLSGTNSYTGNTTVANGTLQAGSASGLCQDSVFTVDMGAFLDLNSYNTTVSSLSGAGTVKLGTATLTVGYNNASGSFDGVIGYAGDTGSLTKTGSGTFSLANTNIFPGVTRLEGGMLKILDDHTLNDTSGLLFAGTATLQIQGDVDPLTPQITLNPGVTGTLDTQGHTLSIGTVIQGAGGNLIKTGGGTLILSGTNTFSGSTTLDGGTLRIGNSGNLQDTSGITFSNTATLQLALGSPSLALAKSITVDGGKAATFDTNGSDLSLPVAIAMGDAAASLTKMSDGVMTLSGNNVYLGATNINGGTIRAGGVAKLSPNSTFTLANGVGPVLDLAGYDNEIGSLAGGGSVTLGNAKLTAGNNNANTTFSGAISDTGSGSFWKKGTGTLILTGINTFQGETTLEGGALRISSQNNLQQTSGITFFDNAKLELGGTIDPLNRPIMIDSGKDATFDTRGFDLNISSTISMGDASASLIKTSSGVMTLSGTNAYSGSTQINGGSLKQGSAMGLSSVSNYSLTNTAGAVLDLNDFDTTIQSLSGGGASGGDVHLGSGTLTLADAVLAPFSGAISGSGGLIKEGLGVFIFGGSSNTYGGTTEIKGGTIQAGVLEAFSNVSPFVIDVGGVLDLNGFSSAIGSLAGVGGNVTLGSNATLTVGGNNTSTTFSGVISDIMNGSLTKTGTGTFTLAGTNTFQGVTTIQQGALQIASNDNLQQASGVVFSGASTLQLGNDIASFTRPITVNAGVAATVDTNGHDLDIPNPITMGSSASSLTKISGGVMTLSGNNSYGGATNIQGGTVKSGFAGGFSLNSPFSLANTSGVELDLNGFDSTILSLSGGGSTGGNVNLGAKTLILAGSASTTFSGAISGTGGGLTHQGSGTLILDGISNTYSGLTTINAGQIQAGAAGALSSASEVVLANNPAGAVLNLNNFNNTIQTLSGGGVNGGNVALGSATLTLSGNVSAAFAGSIGGAGGLTKEGSGVFTLQGTANTYSGTTTINAGTIQAGAVNALSGSSSVILGNTPMVFLDLNNLDNAIGSLSGGGTTGGDVTLGNATLTTGGDNTSTTYSGVISGMGGGLIKVGTGNFSLAGVNTYTGSTEINAGELTVNGSITSNTVVNSAGTLDGTGTIDGNVDVLGTGTVSPGNSIGTLNILGNYTLNPLSVTDIEIDPSSCSLLNIGGTAHLSGTLNINPDPATYPESKTYTILKAAGGLGGTTFSTVHGRSLFSGEDNNLIVDHYLNRMQNIVPGISEIMNTLTELTYSIAYLPTSVELTLDVNALDAALSSISPARNAFTTYGIENTAFALLQVPSAHLSNQRLFHLLPSSKSAALAYQALVQPSHLVASSDDGLPYGRPAAAAKGKNVWDVWIDGIGDFIHQKADYGNPAFDLRTGGSMAGCDFYGFENIVVGGSLGAAATSFDDADEMGGGSFQTYVALSYASFYLGNAYVECGGLAGYVSCQNRRNVVFSDFNHQARSTHSAGEIAPYLHVGYDIEQSLVTIEPFARIDWVAVWQGGFLENGAGVFNMDQDNSFSSMLKGEIGVHFYQTFEQSWGVCILRESLSQVVKQPFDTGTVQAKLIGAPSGFTVESFTRTQNFFSPAIQVFVRGIHGAFCSLNYEGEFGNDNHSNELMLECGLFF